MSDEQTMVADDGHPTKPMTDLRALLRTPLDPLLSDTTRLRLLAALIGLPAAGELAFTALRELLDLTDGNLGLHLRALVERGYADIRKEPRGRRAISFYHATPVGRAAFATHIAALEAIVSAAQGGERMAGSE